MVSNKWGFAFGLNLDHGRRDASRRRSTPCAILIVIPPQRVGTGPPRLGSSCPRCAGRGSSCGPDDCPYQGAEYCFPDAGPQQGSAESHLRLNDSGGSKGLYQKDANLDQKGKRADFRFLGWGASPSPSFSGLPVEGSLQLTSLIPRGDSYREVAPYEELDTAVPSSSSPRAGASTGSNRFRQDHWRGLRRKKLRPEAPRLEAHQESAAPESSASSDWTGWRDWADWGKWDISVFLFYSSPGGWKYFARVVGYRGPVAAQIGPCVLSAN